MSMYGLNRSALNGGVSGIVAGAALVLAVSTFASTSVRTVYPAANITPVVTTAVTGVRNVLPSSVNVIYSSASAEPSLLQLQSADIVCTSGLKATYTEGRFLPVVALQASGFITQPGTGTSLATSATSAVGVRIAGTDAYSYGTLQVLAEPKIKRNGQSTWEVDGYSTVYSLAGLSVDALRTALPEVYVAVSSEASTDSIKTHSGTAYFTGMCSINALGATDLARFTGYSAFEVTGLVTRRGQAVFQPVLNFNADSTATLFPAAITLAGNSGVTANGKSALRGSAAVSGSGDLLASGTRVHIGNATFEDYFNSSAQPALLWYGAANLTGLSGFTALPRSNAEAPDSDARTMIRPATVTAMRRPFNDRTMRRQS